MYLILINLFQSHSDLLYKYTVIVTLIAVCDFVIFCHPWSLAQAYNVSTLSLSTGRLVLF